MAGSIAFERPQENAIEELKEHLSHIDVAITKEQEINNGAGVKLHGLYQNKQVAYVLYFNRSKGQSSKIVAEKSTPEINEQLTRLLTGEIAKGSALKKIPVHSSITIADNRLFPVIKQSLLDAGYLNKEYQKQDHVEYMLKLSFKSDELTLTLFKTGTLLLQGMYSNLFDLVIRLSLYLMKKEHCCWCQKKIEKISWLTCRKNLRLPKALRKKARLKLEVTLGFYLRMTRSAIVQVIY
jgi:hypothetical protein